MLSAKALGLDDTDGYRTIITAIATPLGVIQGLISKQESDPKFAEQKALDDYLQIAKENWPYGITYNIDYQTVEGWGRSGVDFSSKTIIINIWPIEEPKDRQKIVDQLNVYKQYNINNVYDTRITKLEAIITYSDYLSWATKEFKKNYKTLADSNQNNNSTDIPSYEELSSSGTSGSSGSSGGNNNNTGNFIQKFTRALFKRING